MVDHAKHEKNLGWEFVYDKDHIDPVLGIQFLSEAYYKADDDYTGRTTVPALIDTKTGKVVNNDYTWLTNYFEVDFKPFHKKGAPDLYPEELRKDIDEMNDWLFDNINNGVYKATFARSKEAYWDAYNSFYAAMDILEKRLDNRSGGVWYVQAARCNEYPVSPASHTVSHHCLSHNLQREILSLIHI